MNGQNRGNVKIGSKVEVALKLDQKTGKLTRGIVAEILTNSSFHPHGLKPYYGFNGLFSKILFA